MVGYNGEYKACLRLVVDWFWEGMRNTVTKFVRECLVCQQQKASHLQAVELLQHLPIPLLVWEDASMDFVEGLTKLGGFDTILVVVDRLIKYAHILELIPPFTVITVTACFLKEIVWLHGYPSSIVSDRDKVFMSIFWGKNILVTRHKIKQKHDLPPSE